MKREFINLGLFPRYRTMLYIILTLLLVVPDFSPISMSTLARRRKNKVKEGCKVQTSKWTQCSKNCGLGVSTRVSNSNSKCTARRETRLCQLRLCDQKTTPAQAIKVGYG